MKTILFSLAMMFLAIPAWAQTTLYSNPTTGNVGICQSHSGTASAVGQG
jgi:hypothetical protein